MTSSVEWTDLDFKISVALLTIPAFYYIKAGMVRSFSHGDVSMMCLYMALTGFRMTWLISPFFYLNITLCNAIVQDMKPVLICILLNHIYRQLSLSQSPGDQTKYFEISVVWNSQSVTSFTFFMYVELQLARKQSRTVELRNSLIAHCLNILKTSVVNASFASHFLKSIWATTWQNQQNECAPSEDSDQPGHPPSLIRVFAVRSTGS